MKFLNKILNLFKREKHENIHEHISIIIVEEINTKAMAIVSNYDLTEYKIYDVSYVRYSNGHSSWYQFINDHGNISYSHNWRFKLLADIREERIKEIFEN